MPAHVQLPGVFADAVASGWKSLPQPLLLAAQDRHPIFRHCPRPSSRTMLGDIPLYSNGVLGLPRLVHFSSLTFLIPARDPKTSWRQKLSLGSLGHCTHQKEKLTVTECCSVPSTFHIPKEVRVTWSRTLPWAAWPRLYRLLSPRLCHHSERACAA